MGAVPGTPDGQPNLCPLCNSTIRMRTSDSSGEMPCPSCGHPLSYSQLDHGFLFTDATPNGIFKRIRPRLTERLAIPLEAISEDLDDFDPSSLGIDSIDVIQLVMELEEEDG